MAEKIEDLLHRRTDLSTFLVHLTRGFGSTTGRENLIGIMGDSRIEARSVYGLGRLTHADDAGFQASQKVVCFSETPLEHAWMMCAEIEARQMSFAHYGLAFTKVWARRVGVNPVWYLDMTPSGHEWLTPSVNNLLDRACDEAKQGGTPMAEADISRLTPFIEQMGTTAQVRKEFWWEREWRHVGHFVPVEEGRCALCSRERSRGSS
jgi:hypothetical protein